MHSRISTFLLSSFVLVAPLSALQSAAQVPPTSNPSTNPATVPAGPTSSSTTLNDVDRKAFILKARARYYSLKSHGMQEYRFEPVLDWNAFIVGIKADPAGRERILSLTKTLKFQVIVGPTGAASVSHKIDSAPPDDQSAKGLNEMTAGLEQILNGFCQTWSGYSINPLLPDADSEYQVLDTGSAYLVKYKEGEAKILLTIGRDLVIQKLELESAAINATILSTFENGSEGLLLSAYEADYKQGANDAGHLKVTIQHATVNGLQVPNVFTATAASGGENYTYTFTFNNPQIKKQ